MKQVLSLLRSLFAWDEVFNSFFFLSISSRVVSFFVPKRRCVDRPRVRLVHAQRTLGKDVMER